MEEEFGKEVIKALKQENPRFASVYEKHQDLKNNIAEIEAGREHASQFELENLKKQKLKLKDEAYALLYDYTKEVAA